MSKNETRVVYKKDLNLSASGYSDFAEAKEVENNLVANYPEPQYRIRTRLRTRTNTWDVVVKVRNEVNA
jgi:hypothetical protein